MTTRMYKSTDVTYYQKDGLLHRTDGPAVITANGSCWWYLYGKIHRIDGPAIIRANGAQYWYRNDERHRTDGPAVIYPNEKHEWWLNEVQYTLEKYVKIIFPHDCKEKTFFLLKWGDK